MGTFSVHSDIGKLTAKLDAIGKTHVRQAAAEALTYTARIAQLEYQQKLPTIFDRPTPYSQNATFVRPATENTLRASIELKDFSGGKGRPARKYLGPEIFGGDRVTKAFERRIAAMLGLPDDTYLVPGPAAKLDQYGNISRSQMGAILSKLKASGDPGQNFNPLGKRRRSGLYDRDYFILRRGRQPLAVVYREGKGRSNLKFVLIFAKKAPEYTPRLDFVGEMTRVYRDRFPRLFEKALAKAIAGAK